VDNFLGNYLYANSNERKSKRNLQELIKIMKNPNKVERKFSVHIKEILQNYYLTIIVVIFSLISTMTNILSSHYDYGYLGYLGFSFSENMVELVDWPFGVNMWSEFFSLAILITIAYLGESKILKKYWISKILRWFTIFYLVVTPITAYIAMNIRIG